MNRSEDESVTEPILGLPAGSLGPALSKEDRELMDGLRRNLDPKTAVMSRKILSLLQLLRKPTMQKWYWPAGAPFCVCLSHDVDEVRWSWRRRLLMGARHPKTLFEPNMRYWNFERVIDLERRLGLRSSWYFVADGDHPKDPPYRLQDVAGIVQKIQTEGHEVGVHGSYLSYNDGERLRREREAISTLLDRPAVGIRQHYVNFEFPLTWRLQEAAGFTYDSTVAFNNVSGFRTGMCHPYHPTGRTILELPLVLMDGQLFRYEQFTVEEAITECERLAREVADLNGLLTLNWHQHTLDNYSFPGFWVVFEHLVTTLHRMGPTIMTSEKVATWWRARESVSVTLQEQEGRRGRWKLRSSENLGGLTLRLVGASPSHLEADTPFVRAELLDEPALVIPKLAAGTSVIVTAEW